MLFTFFKRDYIVRRFGKETVVEGFSAAPYEDSVLKLEDFQPLSADEIQALPEGQRSIRRIKSIGTTQFTPADEKTGVRGVLRGTVVRVQLLSQVGPYHTGPLRVGVR